jgi:hypothetical protein
MGNSLRISSNSLAGSGFDIAIIAGYLPICFVQALQLAFSFKKTYRNMNYRNITALIALATPFISQANEYQEVLQRLSVESPEFVLHANMEQDFSTLGNLFTEAYRAYQMATPEAPPVPINYEMLFQRLGLTTLKSFTITSEKIGEKGFMNQALFHFDGAPGGAFHLMGDTNQPFTIASEAPADAAMAAEFRIKGSAFLDMVRLIAIDIMGPLGEGLIDAQLSQPITPDGLTILDVANRLDTRCLFAVKPDTESNPAMGPLTGMVAIKMVGIGDLLSSLEPLLQGSGFVRSTDGPSSAWTLSLPNPELPLSISIETIPQTNDLLLTLSEGSRDWFLADDRKIGSSEAFKLAVEDFPSTGVSLWYDDGTISAMQVDNFITEFESNPNLAPVMESLANFMKGFVGGQSGISYFEEDAYRVMSLQKTSYKTQFAVAGMVVPMSLAASLPGLVAAQDPMSDEENTEDLPPQ